MRQQPSGKVISGIGDRAEALRGQFLPLENLRDQWGPARLLHAAGEVAGIARTGPIPPYLASLPAAHQEALRPAGVRAAHRPGRRLRRK